MMELYREEIIFAKCFLAALCLARVEKFEFQGENFENTVDVVEKSLKNLPDGLKLLFARTPLYGNRERFYGAIIEHYPAMFSINFSYNIEANIQIAGGRDVAIQILDDYAPQIGLTIESFRKIAEAFVGKKFKNKGWE